jgi:MYXO-CTERM domain-containing protein
MTFARQLPRRSAPHRRAGRLARTALVAVGLCAPASAFAAPPEWLAKAVVDPSNPQRIVLAYQNRYGGLLFSEDGGKHFDMRCMYSMDRGTIRTRWDGGSSDPVYEVTADGTVLVPTYGGLASGDLNGCGFTQKVGNPGFIADAIARHPTDGNVVYLHMSPNSFAKPEDSCKRHGLWRRDADGTFVEIGPNNTVPGSSADQCQASLTVRSLAAVASGEKVRLYSFGIRYQAGATSFPWLIRYSDEDGGNAVERELPAELNALNVAPTVLLANPANPDELILRFDLQSTQDRLFITRDAGVTFEELEPGQFTNVSNALIDEDGQVWLADRGDTSNAELPKGLWKAESFGAELSHVGSTVPLYCLATSPTGLMGCTLYGFGKLDGATGEVDQIFSIDETRGYVSCADEDVATWCKDQMCNPAAGESWCGPLHHASAPICDAYNSTSPCCGWPARDYDYRAKANLPIDGSCREVPPYYVDAGVAEDGGASQTDAGQADAGSGVGGDSGGSGDSDAGTTTPAAAKKKDDGCSVAQPGHERGSAAWGALALLAGLAARLRRRDRR